MSKWHQAVSFTHVCHRVYMCLIKLHQLIAYLTAKHTSSSHYYLSITFHCYHDSSIFLLNLQFRDSIFHPLILFICTALSLCSFYLLAVSVKPWHRLWERKTERDFIVVCSYLIINPHWSISIPGPLFPLHSIARSDKVAGWLVSGRRSFVFINDSETAYSQTGRSYITINH